MWDGHAADLIFAPDAFDLVLTCGLLIHIPPDQIRQVIEELVRVSKRYVLAIEYAVAASGGRAGELNFF